MVSCVGSLTAIWGQRPRTDQDRLRATIVLAAAAGQANAAIARRLGVCTYTARKWRSRSAIGRLARLKDAPRSGRPPSLPPRTGLRSSRACPTWTSSRPGSRAANRRILDAESVGQGTVLASPAFERVAHPTADAEGRRTPALRFGDPRVMALVGALCQTLLAATGLTNKNLRVLIAGLLGSAYAPGQMTCDLRRLPGPAHRRGPGAGPPTSAPRSWPSPATSMITPPGRASRRRVKLDTNVHKLTTEDR